MKKVSVCVLRSAGTNCDKETAFAFKKAGASPELVHINQLITSQRSLQAYHILVLSGGFSYGDDLGAGKILANELRFKLIGSIVKFLAEGKLILGICNGFQVLVKSGLLPADSHLEQRASLIINDSAKFEARWVYLKNSQFPPKADQPTAGTVSAEGVSAYGWHGSQNKCVWTAGLPEVIYLPVAHGEGKFVCKDKAVLEDLRKKGQIVFQYCDSRGNLGGYPHNPNGSVDNIAGICDETGRILGLMPHPERHIDIAQHPRWEKTGQESNGMLIFRNGVNYAQKIIL